MTILPHLRSSMPGITALQVFQVPFTLMSRWASRSSSLWVRKSPSLQMPALDTRMSMGPKAAWAASTPAFTLAGSDTSIRTAMAFSPSWAASSSTAAPRAARITLAPCLRKVRAMPSPMPLEAPVMRAVFPVSLPIVKQLLLDSISYNIEKIIQNQP